MNSNFSQNYKITNYFIVDYDYDYNYLVKNKIDYDYNYNYFKNCNRLIIDYNYNYWLPHAWCIHSRPTATGL